MSIIKKVASHINDPLSDLKALVKTDFAAIDQKIVALIESEAKLIPEISDYTISAGGKRLRPLLTLASAKMCGYNGDAHIDLAIAVEFIHTATLLHDDVVDKSEMRRGRKTANINWANQEVILVGDYLFAKAFQLMKTANSVEVYDVLSKASVVIAEGEVFQLSLVGDLGISMEQYFQVISAKTAKLFSAAMEVGAVVANAASEQQKALANFGMNLGIAYQLMDDALDYSAKQQVFGKSIGDDFFEGKVTYPLILLHQKLGDEKAQWLSELIRRPSRTKAEFEEVLALMNQYDVIKQSMQKASEYTTLAQGDLSLFVLSDFHTVLCQVLDFVIARLN